MTKIHSRYMLGVYFLLDPMVLFVCAHLKTISSFLGFFFYMVSYSYSSIHKISGSDAVLVESHRGMTTVEMMEQLQNIFSVKIKHFCLVQFYTDMAVTGSKPQLRK